MARYFVTGDTHGDLTRIYNFVNRMELNNENCYIFILGDAGICWRNDRKDLEKTIKNHEDNYRFHLLFIDGNHENFKILKSLKVNDSTGVADLSAHIHYIPRGTVLALAFDKRYKTILFMGGADSIDKNLRVPNLSWWEDEQITKEDIEKGIPGKYDYVFTHCCPTSIFDNNKVFLCTLDNIVDDTDPELHISENRLEELKRQITFDKWYFGHYHTTRQIDDRFTCLYEDFIELN